MAQPKISVRAYDEDRTQVAIFVDDVQIGIGDRGSEEVGDLVSKLKADPDYAFRSKVMALGTIKPEPLGVDDPLV